MDIFRVPGGYSWQFLWGCSAWFSKSWPYFRPRNVIFHTRFQTWPLGRNYVTITQIRAETKKFFKGISNSHISISFLFIWNWNGKYVHTFPQFPRKPHPIPNPNGQSVYYQFSDQKGPKTIPFGAVHTYLDYIREYPPGGIPPPVHTFNPESRSHCFFWNPESQPSNEKNPAGSRKTY